MGNAPSLSFFPVVSHPSPTLFDPHYGGIGGQNIRIFGSLFLSENDGRNACYLRKIRCIMDY
jgi:hypothetical protein